MGTHKDYVDYNRNLSDSPHKKLCMNLRRHCFNKRFAVTMVTAKNRTILTSFSGSA